MSCISQPARFAKKTTAEVIEPEALRRPKTQLGYRYWRSLCGTRRFPARDEINPRDIAAALTNMILVKAIDGGADFQFRIVGDHAGRGYRADLNNRTFSSMEDELPRAVANWYRVYRGIVDTGRPLAVDIVTGIDAPYVNFTEAEAVFLPLGPSDGTVDHVLTFIQHALKS